VAEGFAKAKRIAQRVAFITAPEDHPVLCAFPEGEYLKNLLVRAVSA
jgi:23S rRNA G2069 N7-methylase RlmK/C1962 C5-methylase RlmI